MPGVTLLRPAPLDHRPVKVGHQPSRLGQERLTSWGELYPAAGTDEQPGSDLALQTFDLVCERGLRQAEMVCGVSKVQPLGDLHERRQ
jgi:hypothetical protein